MGCNMMYYIMMQHGVKCCAVKSYLKSLGPAYPLIWNQDGASFMGERSLHEIFVEITGYIWDIYIYMYIFNAYTIHITYIHIIYIYISLIFQHTPHGNQGIPRSPSNPTDSQVSGKQDSEGRNEGLSGAWCSLKACGAGCRPRAKLHCI